MSEINTHYLRLLEAVLFSSTEVMAEKMLARALPEEADLPALLKELQSQYAERGVRLVQADFKLAAPAPPQHRSLADCHKRNANQLGVLLLAQTGT